MQDREISVPRDDDVDRAESSARNPTPAPGTQANPNDETAPRRELMADSPLAREMHEHPPKGPGQLDVGTGGDAARPGKEGIHDQPIPPRSRV